MSRIDGWRRWLVGIIALVGVLCLFIWGVRSMQPDLGRKVNPETQRAVARAEISAAVDGLLSSAGALSNIDAPEATRLNVDDAAAHAVPSLARFASWGQSVQALEPDLRHGAIRLTMPQALRLRDVLGKRIEWPDAALRDAIERPMTGALGSWEEAVRLSRLGCATLKSALIGEVLSAAPWSTPLRDVSEALGKLRRETPEEPLQYLRRLHSAVPELKRSLDGVRSLKAGLDELLKTRSFQELHRLFSTSELLRESCSLDAESIETQFLLTEGAASGLLVETEAGISVSDELNRVEEAVTAFLDLDLFSVPGPSECKLAQDGPFEWVPQGISAANKALRAVPKQTLLGLARLQKTGRGNLMDHVSGALPRAACEKVTQLVCTHLKRGRAVQTQRQGVGALRRRASSLALASRDLREIGEQARDLGCARAFGLSDAEDYARTLMDQGDNVVVENLNAIRARLEQVPSSNDEPRAIRERAMDQIRLQRMEVGAVAVGIIEPALLFLEQSGAQLRSQEHRWKAALIDINRGRPVNASDAPDSGLFAFERLLGIFLVRTNETCELAASGSVSNLMGERSGVFYDLGRHLVAAIGQQCGSKDHG